MQASFTSEPSVGPMGYVIRLMLSKRLVSEQRSRAQAALSNDSTALLFAADRLDHLQHEILPLVNRGAFVVCDRYYISSYAYQMNADRSNYAWLKSINSHCRKPDLTLFLKTAPEECEKRRRHDRWHRELYEEPEILERVSENYDHVIADLEQASERIEIIDGNLSPDSVFRQMRTTVSQVFSEVFLDDYPLIRELL